jgi:DNA-binding GntR family transcriptional regulator
MSDRKTISKQKVYDTIKRNIMYCKYMPHSFLSEKMLAAELGTSRTPVREALSTLAQEGWITIQPWRGIVVSDLTMNDIRIAYETRLIIEPYAIEKYGAGIEKEKLRELQDRFSRLREESNREEIGEADNELHRCIVKPSKNRYFISAMEQLILQTHRIRILVPYHRDVALTEHDAIIHALLEERFAEACALIRSHLEESMNSSYKALMENGGWSIPL